MRSVVSAVSCCLLLGACFGPPPRDLAELIVEDSTYLDPATQAPYAGPVFRSFPELPDVIQLESTLADGTWQGELTVYHRTGRIRYQGEMSEGVQCGAWVENDEPEVPGSLYEEIKEELESLVMYPPCP